MPASVVQDDARFLIRLEGEIGVSDAAELKNLLLEGLASGRKVHLDLEQAKEIDVTFMQLWQAALREAGRAGQQIEMRLSEAAQVALRRAGLAPGAVGDGWGG